MRYTFIRDGELPEILIGFELNGRKITESQLTTILMVWYRMAEYGYGILVEEDTEDD